MNAVAERPAPIRFDGDAAQHAGDEWGFNCGPGSIAAILDLTPAEVRPHLGDFEKKRYTNPTLMFEILNRIGAKWKKREKVWPRYGLVRVQWEGPWTAPGAPMMARYRHTHWVGAQRFGRAADIWVFDINAAYFGGWIPFAEWSNQLVPWLLNECEPKASGKWHITHARWKSNAATTYWIDRER